MNALELIQDELKHILQEIEMNRTHSENHFQKSEEYKRDNLKLMQDAESLQDAIKKLS